jgi:ketosteroid isomerase-like protein
MTRPGPAPIAHRFATAFATRDVERVVDCFTPDATYDDLFYGRFTGADGLRELFGRMYAEGDRHEWAMTRVLTGPDCTIGEWTFTFTASAAVPSGAGRTVRFPGVSVFETDGGRCRAYREHFDRTAALLALGVPAGRVAALVARRSSVRLVGERP